MGWLFGHSRSDRERYAKDLLQDRMTMAVSRLFPLWAVLTFAVPFVLGGLLTMSWKGAVTGLVWGGLVRLFFNHHITWSVNSICHFFGKRPFAAGDHSTNNWVLALPSLGESWHHNHHVFPTSAFHGLGWRQVDLSGLDDRRLGEDRPGAERAQADGRADRPQAGRLTRQLTGPSSHAAMLLGVHGDLILHGDNLALMADFADGAFRMVYTDPPFNTGRAQTRSTVRVTPDAAGDRTGFGGRRYRTELLERSSYRDSFDDYLGFLEPRLREIRRLLDAEGTLYLHLDQREAHYVKLLLDEVFGRDVAS